MGLFLPDAGCGKGVEQGEVKAVISVEKPAHQRAEHPEFWNVRFQSGCTPWQNGDFHADLPRLLPGLVEFLGLRAAHPQPLTGLRMLIPGCGHAFEAAYFAELGAEVVALDFSLAAIKTAQALLGDWSGELWHGDFFTYAPAQKFDFLFERAFLCALPRRLWPDYAQQAARLLKPAGALGGFFFYGEEGKGPPFAAVPQTLQIHFAPFFSCADDQPIEHPLPLFTGERWQVWRRLPTTD
jgi:thiopurine S-methyltransferase